MNKGRVEAFTDGVVAIILTIMILEFKTPETAKWEGIITQLPYFFAYVVSFLFRRRGLVQSSLHVCLSH